MVELRRAVGVPAITHVEELTLSVAGNAVVLALMSQAVIAAPLVVNVVGETLMAWLTVPAVPVAPA